MPTFSYTGSVQQWTVPAGVLQVKIECYGAPGGATVVANRAKGGKATGFLTVTAGETLYVFVGGAGEADTSSWRPGGWNGGGDSNDIYAGSGGGASDVRVGGTGLSNRVIVAGGGGGSYSYNGGVGGGTTGGNGGANFPAAAGKGGTQTSGGDGGDWVNEDGSIYDTDYGLDGTLGAGGKGGPCGGGGGYYGGGGGGLDVYAGSYYYAGGGGGSGYIGGVSNGVMESGVSSNASVVITIANTPPNAPSLVTPENNAGLNLQLANTFSWQFNDPDSGDSQSAYNFAYRVVGATTWVETGWVTSIVSQKTIPAGTFTAGDYEWRVATKDAQGLESPWSATGFFTAAYAPPGPTITDPPNGGNIPTAEYPVVWSTPDQDAYRLRVLDGTTAVYDSGQVDSATARSRVVTFPDNGVTRTIELSVLVDGLWSPASTVTVTVSYTPPPAGVVSVTANPTHGSLIITPSFPAPVSPEPSVVGYDVWMRRVGTTGDGIRLAASVPPQQSWEWWLPASGVDYEFRVRGLGGNGTSSWSVWAPGVPVYNLVQNPRGRTTSGTVVVRENLLIRPSADSGTTGWTPGGQANSTITTSTDIPRRSGRPAGPVFKIVANNSGLAFAFTTNTNTPVAQVGETYTLVGYVYVPAGTPNILLDSFGAIDADSTIVSTKDAWVRVSATGVATSASAIGFGLATPNFIQLQVDAGDVFYVDDMSIEKTSVVNDPFTGSWSPDPDLTPAWTGTVDASPSQLLGPAPVGWAGGYYSASTDAVKVPASGSSVSVPSGAATLVLFDPTTGQTTYTPTTGGTVAIPGPATVRAAVVPGAYAGPYFDGDSLGAYWLGDEHESVSIIYPVDG